MERKCLRIGVVDGSIDLPENQRFIGCSLCRLQALIILKDGRRGIRAPWEECRLSEGGINSEDLLRECRSGVLA